MSTERREPARQIDTAAADSAGNAHLRENRIGRALVRLADTLVDDFDLTEFLHTLVDQCVELLDVDAAGVLLADRRGGLQVAAASSERAELLEVFAMEADDGPCVESARTGNVVVIEDLTAEPRRWPRFAATAEACGFRAIHVLPLRLRREVIGALSLLDRNASGVHSMSAQLGQALADVATIGILQQRTIGHAELVAGQLQSALTTRVVIEQAKGVLAAHGGAELTPDGAFTALRGYSRSHHHHLTELAGHVVAGTADVAAILGHGRE